MRGDRDPMQRLTGVILSIYNFFVGDPVILSVSVALFALVAILTHTIFAGARSPIAAVVLVLGVMLSLSLALRREITPKRP